MSSGSTFPVSLEYGGVLAILERKTPDAADFSLVATGALVGPQTVVTAGHAIPRVGALASRSRVFSQIHGVELVAGASGNPRRPGERPKTFLREQHTLNAANELDSWAQDWGAISLLAPLDGVTPFSIRKKPVSTRTEAVLLGFGYTSEGFLERHRVSVSPLPGHDRLLLLDSAHEAVGEGDSGAPVLVGRELAGVYVGAKAVAGVARKLVAVVHDPPWWQATMNESEFRSHWPRRSVIAAGSPNSGGQICHVSAVSGYTHEITIDRDVDVLSVTVTGLSPDKEYALEMHHASRKLCTRRVRSYYQTVRFSSPFAGTWQLKVRGASGGQIQMAWTALSGRRSRQTGCYEMRAP